RRVIRISRTIQQRVDLGATDLEISQVDVAQFVAFGMDKGGGGRIRGQRVAAGILHAGHNDRVTGTFDQRRINAQIHGVRGWARLATKKETAAIDTIISDVQGAGADGPGESDTDLSRATQARGGVHGERAAESSIDQHIIAELAPSRGTGAGMPRNGQAKVKLL